jgi:hypothetical protein
MIDISQGPTHPVGKGFAIDSARCIQHCASAALTAWDGRFPDLVLPSALLLLAGDRLGRGDKAAAFQLYGAASAREVAAVEDAGLRQAVCARLAQRRAQALADPLVFEHWRTGERMSLDELAILLTQTLDVSGPRTADGRPQTNSSGRQYAASDALAAVRHLRSALER